MEGGGKKNCSTEKKKTSGEKGDEKNGFFCLEEEEDKKSRIAREKNANFATLPIEFCEFRDTSQHSGLTERVQVDEQDERPVEREEKQRKWTKKEKKNNKCSLHHYRNALLIFAWQSGNFFLRFFQRFLSFFGRNLLIFCCGCLELTSVNSIGR